MVIRHGSNGFTAGDTTWFRSGSVTNLFSQNFVYCVFLVSDARHHAIEVIIVVLEKIGV